MADPAVGTNSEIFDPSKEKKKKKKKVLDLDSVLLGSSSAPVDEEVVVDPVSVDADNQEAGEGEPGAHDDILESLETFGSKKKKKKVKKIVDEEIAAVIEEVLTGGLEGEEALDFDFSKKKKKKGAKGIDDLVAGEELEGGGCLFLHIRVILVLRWVKCCVLLDVSRCYYAGLVIEEKRLAGGVFTTLTPGSKRKDARRGWCSSMRVRSPDKENSRGGTSEALARFLVCPSWGRAGVSMGTISLFIKAVPAEETDRNVLRRYIKGVRHCHTCRSPNTLLQKDFRLFFLQSRGCGSRCSRASIKHGFQAVTGKRAAMRAKAN
ncbi:Eukaryotic translation initiation factor 2 subunit 2 [Orchesella cincta]|uniref:Eukaryotic translation initiation factor 2 subunit 2 n=1 Tax=Orchesella cincta TaxID=48709 RepID=A0A1D2N2P4_ORCCI|nr:Eukaryotic translation initiation factor 2 subunit 2 [Orchesella cincta]